MYIIWHKVLIFDSLLDNRMPAIYNVHASTLIYFRTGIIIHFGSLGQPCHYINLSNKFSCFFDTLVLKCHLFAYPVKNLEF